MSIQEELLAIKGTDELLVPERVVEWAKAHPASYLYRSLEWDDSKAAHEYRLWQVRRLISLNVVTSEGVRQLVSLSIDRPRIGGGYRSLDDVLARRDLHEVLLDDALAELDRVQAKYDQLKELAPIWREKESVRRRRERKEGKRPAAAAAAS